MRRPRFHSAAQANLAECCAASFRCIPSLETSVRRELCNKAKRRTTGTDAWVMEAILRPFASTPSSVRDRGTSNGPSENRRQHGSTQRRLYVFSQHALCRSTSHMPAHFYVSASTAPSNRPGHHKLETVRGQFSSRTGSEV